MTMIEIEDQLWLSHVRTASRTLPDPDERKRTTDWEECRHFHQTRRKEGKEGGAMAT